MVVLKLFLGGTLFFMVAKPSLTFVSFTSYSF